MFVAQTQADLATVEKRLAEIEAELQAVELAAPAAALKAALGTGTEEDVALIARLPVLRAEAASLQMAKEAAEQAEADRLAAAKNREIAASCRAATQHVARCEKEILAAMVAAENSAKAFARAVDAGRSALALLPRSLRAQAYPDMALSSKRLRRWILLQFARTGRETGQSVVQDIAAFSRDVETPDGKIPDVSGLLAKDLAVLRADLRKVLSRVAEPAEDAA